MLNPVAEETWKSKFSKKPNRCPHVWEDAHECGDKIPWTPIFEVKWISIQSVVDLQCCALNTRRKHLIISGGATAQTAPRFTGLFPFIQSLC